MLFRSHACPSSVLADGQRPSGERRLVQPVDESRKIGRTKNVPAEIDVVPDYIGRTSKRLAIDSPVGCERGQPTRILGLGQGVQCRTVGVGSGPPPFPNSFP